MVSQDDSILIVGAGCFGISTAYHLLQRGFTTVTVIDRSKVLPAPDAASTDINKIVRTSYSDPFYAQLARDAIQSWKNVEEWGDTYHESGVVVLGSDEVYASDSYTNDVAIGARITNLDDRKAILSAFPSDVKIGALDGMKGYLNRDGGWAFATQGITKMTDRVRSMGGTVIGAKDARELLRVNGRTTGVKCSDGTTMDADLVVIASGSWTASSFSELDLETSCLATGQSIVTIQLTPDEAERYRQCPVILDFAATGFYMFPPNSDNVIKMAVHAVGYTNYASDNTFKKTVSTPRTILSHDKDGLLIPKVNAKFIREQVSQIYPELALKPFTSTRMCWYTDSPDGDWLIGYYPSDAGLMLATSGSGHAYKFLPVLGRLVADSIQGILDESIAQRFSPSRAYVKHDASRPRVDITDLASEQLCAAEDLLPQ